MNTNQLAIRWPHGSTGAMVVHDSNGVSVDDSAAPAAVAIGIMTNDRFANPLGPDGFELSLPMFPRLDGLPILGGSFGIEISIPGFTFPSSPPSGVPETLDFSVRPATFSG